MRTTGAANEHDLVGRYFMEHWYVDLPLGRAGDAHDLQFYRNPEPLGEARIWGQLAAPTLTNVALALRLADHLRGTVSAPSVV